MNYVIGCILLLGQKPSNKVGFVFASMLLFWIRAGTTKLIVDCKLNSFIANVRHGNHRGQ